jgi:peptidoglycan/xylan/chitin deacetylase (PgdA/CDA1 family)
MNSISILMYHNINPPPKEGRLPALYVKPRAFAAHMRLLRILGFHGLSMAAAMPYLRGEKRGRVAVITFDDGYVDTLEQALPVLRAHGFSATCYVVSGEVGRYNAWDAEEINVREPLMDLRQLRVWQDAGMEIGAHSRSHPRLRTCGDAELEAEVAGSKRDLEELLGQPVTQFCYPYGDFDTRVVEAVRRAGFAAAVTVQRGRARLGDDFLQLRRITVSNYHRSPHLAFKLLSAREDRRR